MVGKKQKTEAYSFEKCNKMFQWFQANVSLHYCVTTAYVFVSLVNSYILINWNI